MTGDTRRGVLAALGAYLAWGLFPLFFKALGGVPALEVLANRVLWSGVLSLGILLALGRMEPLLAVLRDRRRLAGLAASALCISVNWGCFIWAVAQGRALEASLGYYIYPLFSVLLGALLLKERLGRRQWLAVGLVGLGVLALTLGHGGLPWLVLAFPLSFGLYGLLRRVVPVEALTGFAIETLLLLPLALGYLLTLPRGGALLEGGSASLLLVAAGPVTALPLVLFGYGARRLRMATLGLMQYINPTLQMAVAILLLGERPQAVQAVTFACVWAGLILYSWPAGRGRRP